jgi:hypothetical protein
LRACGLNPPRENANGYNGTAEEKELLEELWVHIGTDDEGETPYGGDLNR